jgi:hypothetical protein
VGRAGGGEQNQYPSIVACSAQTNQGECRGAWRKVGFGMLAFYKKTLTRLVVFRFVILEHRVICPSSL